MLHCQYSTMYKEAHGYAELEELEKQCLACQKCGLAETRHHVVFGTGPRDAEVMCIGEGPGENEDLQGLPFVGRGGHLLDEMLELIDLSRDKNRLHREYGKVPSPPTTATP